jgi:surface antigen
MNKKIIGCAVGGVLLAAGAAISGAIVNINIENGKIKASIVYSEEAKTPELTGGLDKIEYGQGEIKADGEVIPTVEEVDSTGLQVNPEDEAPLDCPEGEECGRGASYPYVDTTTPQAFLNATLGGCYDVDGRYNEQCWDYAALFFLNYAGRTFSTCGTGAAKGAFADGCWQKNAGNEFVMIWDANQLQPGDIVGFNSGTYGHVGMAAGYYNNGYITLEGQNQGGGLCPGSTMGARTNIINISLKSFAGAFRPKTYIKPEPTPPSPAPEPEPEPVIDTCKVWEVKKGDTMGKIMKTCRGEIKWGAEMDAYASHWYSVKFKKTLTVFDGWNNYPGVGLFAGDIIEYRSGE